MSTSAWGQLILFLVVLFFTASPLGAWITKVYNGELPKVFLKVEDYIYRALGTSVDKSMNWSHYAYALVAFNAVGVLFVSRQYIA